MELQKNSRVNHKHNPTLQRIRCKHRRPKYLHHQQPRTVPATIRGRSSANGSRAKPSRQGANNTVPRSRLRKAKRKSARGKPDSQNMAS